jgi:N-(2-amino-2-carboxyethyl)-L-glutamate synthase
MIYESVAASIGRTPLVRLRRLFPYEGFDIITKLEFLNPGGSIKDRPARYIIEQGLRDGSITADTHLIESSSGNLGIAIAMLARVYDLRFTCVVDPKISRVNLQILRQLGAHIEMVQERDDQKGYLKTRLVRVQDLLRETERGLWINQYANQLNTQAHYYQTCGEILADLDGPVDCFVAAVSTAGTIMGVGRRLRQEFPRLRVIAVDAVGSIIFGGYPGMREIPGIGASRVPELLNRDAIDEVVYVNDLEAVHGCHDLVNREGILAGGSSGSVVAAIQKLLPTLSPPCRIVTLFPDRGDRYLHTIYNEDWIERLSAQMYESSLNALLTE